MTITLVLPEHVAAEVEAAASNPMETAGVVLVNPLEDSSGDARLLARQLHPVREEAYLTRAHDRLSIACEGYVHVLAEAERLGAIPIWFHTHPGVDGIPIASAHDLQVDREIADLFRLRSGSSCYGTLIVSPRRGSFVFTGTMQPQERAAMKIDRVWRPGDKWQLIQAFDAHQTDISPIFSRNIRAFGAAIQGALGDLRIAIVGCGGTGSAVAEQLVRLGVRRLMLIDSDRLTESNVTRVYGSTPADIGRPKAEILRDHLVAIAPDLACDLILTMVTMEATARRLTSRDLVFGCTDDNAGRLVISRLAAYLLTPVIDVGVLLSCDTEGTLSGIDGRVTILIAGSACLVCRDRVDLARAAAELRTPEERRRLEDEGYAPALGAVEPAVVAFTTAVAAAAVNELLERLIGYGPSPRPSEILLRLHEREISTNCATPHRGHYCDRDSGTLGAVANPFLGQIWPDV